MSASSTGLLAAEGPGSVSQAPNLADGFTDTFTSRYVDAGALRLHAVIGGDGPPLLLVHGWPQTWYAWRLMMPALAENFEVIAVDQRGMGLSDKPRDGYDTATVANDLVALMDALGIKRAVFAGYDNAQFGKLDVESKPYLWLNLVGSVILTALAWHEKQWGFLLLEGVWAIVSAYSLVRGPRGVPAH